VCFLSSVASEDHGIFYFYFHFFAQLAAANDGKTPPPYVPPQSRALPNILSADSSDFRLVVEFII
jgi:hypothetical protein